MNNKKNIKKHMTHPKGEHGTIEYEDLSVEKAEAFEQQQAIMERIKEMGFARYVETLPNLGDAFDLEKHKPVDNLHKCVCCMDERTPYGVHSAGSGILLSDADFDQYFKKSGADSISSHTGCGAAKLYAEKMGLAGDPDAIAREWAERKAKEKGIPHVHLDVEKPFHFSRVCYYDGTGRFNYNGVQGLPAGFVVGRKFMNQDSSTAEGGVAKDIIFGHHGFGEELLTKENPFLFVAIGENIGAVNKLKKELEILTAKFGNKVAVDGFVVPKATEAVEPEQIAA